MHVQYKSIIHLAFLVTIPLLVFTAVLGWLGPHQVAASHPIVSQGSSSMTVSHAITLSVLGTYETGIFDEGAAEIVAHDPISQRAFVVNGFDTAVDILDVSTPTSPTLVSQIDITPYGGSLNSVAVHADIVVAAVEHITPTLPGTAVFFDTDGSFINQVTVGALPDMITFSPDGSTVLVANEGEPNDDYTVDPEGSISLIDISGGVALSVSTADFTAYNDHLEALRPRGQRGPGLRTRIHCRQSRQQHRLCHLTRKQRLCHRGHGISYRCGYFAPGLQRSQPGHGRVDPHHFTDLPFLGRRWAVRIFFWAISLAYGLKA